MQILPLSQNYSKNNNIGFKSQKDIKVKNSNITVPSGIKKTVPAAALILATIGSPVDKAEAHPYGYYPGYHAYYPYYPSTYYCPPPPPPRTYYYEPYSYVLPTMMMLQYMQNVAIASNAYTNQVSPVSVGGVAFNKQDIDYVGAYDYEDRAFNNVVLKNGTIITFPNQYESRYAAVYRNNEGYVIEGLKDGVVQGSNNRDRYILNGCENTVVNVADDGSKDRVNVLKYRILPNGLRQYTDEVSVIADEKDIVNDQKADYDYQRTTYSGYDY